MNRLFFILTLSAFQALNCTASAETLVRDIFGRSLNERGIQLVDWDGYMANPLIRLYLLPPLNAALPGSATLTANGGRLYFGNSIRAGDRRGTRRRRGAGVDVVRTNGAVATIAFTSSATAVPIDLSIFPAHSSAGEDDTLTIVFTDANKIKQTNTVPIRVIDEDLHQSNTFVVTVNFDRDRTGFFTNVTARALVNQAANDWTYYFAGINLDRVRAGAEKTYIWSNNFDGGYDFSNTNDYAGYLLYAYGITNAMDTSGGEGSSAGRLQTSNGLPLSMKRSGGFEANIRGNYNTRGWLFLTNDDDWVASGNGSNQTNDFYSIAHHEIGHALIFNKAHPGFAEVIAKGAFTSAAVTNYYGRPVLVNAADDHLKGVIDPESGQGAFGYEYHGDIPRRRWTMTKLDLLCAQEVGYVLKPNPAFSPFVFATNALPAAYKDAPFTFTFIATGGIPVYAWDITAGALPPGLALDPFSGTLSGTPTATGLFNFTVRVRDYHERSPGLTQNVTLNITQPRSTQRPRRRRRENKAPVDSSGLTSTNTTSSAAAGNEVASEAAVQNATPSFFTDGSLWHAENSNVPADRVKPNDPARSMMFDASALTMDFSGADPAAHYELVLSFLSDSDDRVQQISAGGIVLEDRLALPKYQVLRKQWPIPANAIRNSQLEVKVVSLAGPNAIVSAVSVIARSPDAQPLKPILPAPPVIPDVRMTPVPIAVRNVKAPILDLNGTWMFNPQPPRAFPEQPISAAEHHPNDWKPIRVPGEWVMEGFTVSPNTHAAYERSFTVPQDWTDGRIKLHCDGVYSDARIFVNGQLAGGHIGGFTPFELDVTDLVHPGDTNTLLVGVRNDSIADTLSSGSKYAAHELGGISRKIYLVRVPDVSVSDIYSRTEFDRAFANATLVVQVEVANDSDKDVTGETLKLSLTPSSAGTTAPLPSIPARRTITREVRLPVTAPLKWDPEHPHLYTLQCALSRNGEQFETVDQHVGFRQVDLRGNQLFVNNVPVKLRGICRHETDPLLGRAITPALDRQDVELFREMNANSIRTSHYPATQEFVQDCDELGLFIEEEAPFCWAVNSSSAKTRDYILQAEIETIRRDRSDPAVIFWSMGNESAWGRNFALAQPILKNLDSSRPYCFEGGQELAPPPDIDTPHYPGLGGPAAYANNPRPALFGEYGHLNCYNRCQLMTDPGLREFWGDVVDKMWQRMRASPGCLGGNIWAGIDDMFDLPGSGVVGYGAWGSLDGWRRRKPEFWQLKNIYCPLEISGGDIALPDNSSPLRIRVKNQSLFSDLNEFHFKWTLNGHTGQASISATAPGGTGELAILDAPLATNSKLLLQAFDPRGVMVNTWEFILDPTAPDTEPALPPSKLTLHRNADLLTVNGPGFQWELDGRTGKIRQATIGGEPLLIGGPDLMLQPLIGDPDNSQQLAPVAYPPSTESCSAWAATSVAAREVGNTIEITVNGNYHEAKGNYVMRFEGTGKLTVTYNFTLLRAINFWQRGLVFDLPRSCDTLSWRRKAHWIWHPEEDIGRPVGTAKALTDHPLTDYTGPHTRPTWPWSQDNTPFGSNDFRSTKRNILRAGLTSTSGVGVAALSDGRQSTRCWLDANRVRLLVADFVNAGSGAFVEQAGPHRPMKAGAAVRGTATLQLQPTAQLRGLRSLGPQPDAGRITKGQKQSE